MATILDLDAMMDETLDAVADIPDFVNPPAGTYQIAIKSCEVKPVPAKPAKGDKPATPAGSQIRITYSVAETIETKGEPVPNGSLFSENFQGTDQGLEFFKARAKNILNADVTGVPLRSIMEEVGKAEFKAVLGLRKTTGDAGQEYENVTIRPVHAAA